MSRARFWRIVPLALACAAPPPPLPPGVSSRPELGDRLETLLTKLPHPEEPGPAVEVTELRVLAVDAQPWTTLEPARAEGAPGRVGVVAGRRCRFWEGVRRKQTDRASWFLFEAGVLAAFDHDGFAAGCAPHSAFEPASRADAPLERMLVRYVSQRWPVDRVPAEERLARGLRLLERSRPDDARAELQALDLRIAELARRQDELETPDPAERAALFEEEERLRPLRAELRRALDETREQSGELR